jgi:hypothetical protein
MFVWAICDLRFALCILLRSIAWHGYKASEWKALLDQKPLSIERAWFFRASKACESVGSWAKRICHERTRDAVFSD